MIVVEQDIAKTILDSNKKNTNQFSQNKVTKVLAKYFRKRKSSVHQTLLRWCLLGILTSSIVIEFQNDQQKIKGKKACKIARMFHVS